MAAVDGYGSIAVQSCDRDDVAARSGWEFEQERMAITQKLALAEYRFSQAPVDFTGRLSELQQDLASLSRQTAELKQRRSRLLAEIRIWKTATSDTRSKPSKSGGRMRSAPAIQLSS